MHPALPMSLKMALSGVAPLNNEGQHFKISACIFGGMSVGKYGLKAKLECNDLYGRKYDPRLKDVRTKLFVDNTEYSLSLSVSNRDPGDHFLFEEMDHMYGYIVTYRAIILAYSVSSQASFDHAIAMYYRIRERRKDRDLPIPILLVACQGDKRYREVSTATGRNWAAQHDDVVFEETSALTGQNVRKAFQKLVKQLHMYLDWRLLPIPKFARLPMTISIGRE